MLPALLAKIGLPILINAVTTALGTIDNPVAKSASTALQKVDTAMTTGLINPETVKEANRHLETLATLDSTEFKTLIEQVNASLRAEAVSEDIYVRRMRPTFGYIMAFTWAAQMLAIAAVILEDPERAVIVMQAMSSLDMIWTVGLSVLGVYVYKRSQEKAAPAATSPFVTSLARAVQNALPAEKIKKQ